MAATLMDGFPPSPDRLVTLANWRKAPFSAWGFRNVRRLVPTAAIAASGHAIPLEASLEDISQVGFAGHDGKPTTLGHALRATDTDAFIVLRLGRIAAEWYGPGMDGHHAAHRVFRQQIDLRRARRHSGRARPARPGCPCHRHRA
jgi:hypothetical protein